MVAAGDERVTGRTKNDAGLLAQLFRRFHHLFPQFAGGLEVVVQNRLSCCAPLFDLFGAELLHLHTVLLGRFECWAPDGARVIS